MSSDAILPSQPSPVVRPEPDNTKRHPLHNITPAEVLRASRIALQRIRERENSPTRHVRFKNISLSEPPKALLLAYLDAEACGVPIEDRPYIPRCVEVVYAMDCEKKFGTMVVSLDSGTETEFKPALKGQHSSMDR